MKSNLAAITSDAIALADATAHKCEKLLDALVCLGDDRAVDTLAQRIAAVEFAARALKHTAENQSALARMQSEEADDEDQ